MTTLSLMALRREQDDSIADKAGESEFQLHVRQIRGPNTTDELLSLFDATGDSAADWKPSYSVAPTDLAPIVRE
ncbi:hypothetical protein E3N86_04765 [Cryobacterium sp. Hz7]|uniref:hypothetical protein n=1 Tax=Cryobacterium sp. Hz7 TaxID=1259166 RepID=UPI0010696474|nr:hypothetical protein [Cryobacterium sp. Hz7]TFB63490.1 hypothetical protein E3N86_04765 [Cryobacterium sp. Hz7]